MAAKKPANVHPTTGEILDGTFGDEGDPNIAQFAQVDGTYTRPAFTADQLDAIANAEDPLALLAEYAAANGVAEIATANDILGDGTVVIEKPMLMNKPFIVLDWRFHISTRHKGRSFCAIKCVDPAIQAGQPGRMFVFTDGGVGIYERLSMFQLKNDNKTVPFQAPYGLAPSTYTMFDDDNEEIGEGTTYWFANAPVTP